MSNMINYIYEQPSVLDHVMKNQKLVTKTFVDIVKEQNIKRVYITGSGTSAHAGLIIKYFMEKMLNVEVSFHVPSKFVDEEVINRNKAYDNEEIMVLAISQGGKSSATINAVKKALESNVTTIVLTSKLDSPISKLTDHIIPLLCGEENVPPETKGYTSTLLTLILCTLEVAEEQFVITKEKYNEYINKIVELISGLGDLIEQADTWYKRHKDELLTGKKFVLIGEGVNYATALEGALKLYETVRRPVIAYELEEFLHGPYMAVDEDTFLFFIGAKGKGLEKMKKINKYFSAITDHRFLIVNKENSNNEDKDICLHSLDFEDLSPIEYVIPFQIIAYRLATDIGIDTSVLAFPDFSSVVGSKVNYAVK